MPYNYKIAATYGGIAPDIKGSKMYDSGGPKKNMYSSADDFENS